MKLLAIFGTTILCLGPGSGFAAAEVRPPAEIVLGMSTALTGPAANLGNDVRRGVVAALERANRAGGVNGRRLRLVALDDGYEPARTGPNVRRLIEQENVLAMICDVGTPTAIVALPIANSQKTLYFAAVSGGGVLRSTPPERYVINYRAGYAEETGAMVDALVGSAGLQPGDIAFFTQRDGYGDAGFSGGIAALKRHGLQDEKAVLHVRYERNTLAVESAVASLVVAEHPPRAIVMVGTYRPCAKFIKLCRAADMQPLFLNVSFVGSNSLAKELSQTDAHVIVTQVVPHPLDRSLPIVRDYLTDLQASEPSAAPGFSDLEGYIATRMFLTALATIKGEPTREGIVEALDGLGSFDLGLGQPLRLSPKEHQACNHVWPTILQEGAFVPFSWAEMAALAKQEASR